MTIFVERRKQFIAYQFEGIADGPSKDSHVFEGVLEQPTRSQIGEQEEHGGFCPLCGKPWNSHALLGQAWLCESSWIIEDASMKLGWRVISAENLLRDYVQKDSIDEQS